VPLAGLQLRVTDCEVRLVAQRHQLRPLRLDRADAVQEREPALRLPRAHQRDAEVELPVQEPVARTLPVRQFRDRLVVAAAVEKSLRDQEPAFRLHFLRQRAGGLAQRPVRLLELAGCIQELADVEPGAALHVRRRRRVREQLLEDFARLAVLAERQVQAAAQELRVARVGREPALVAVGREPHERGEVVLLVEMEQDVAVMQVLHFHGRQARQRVLIYGRRGEGGRRGRREDDE
jgi:hypothetical protein